MNLKIGDKIRHRKLKKRGFLVELLRDEQAKIAIGSITIKAAIADLELIKEEDKKTKKSRKNKSFKSAEPYKKKVKIGFTWT